MEARLASETDLAGFREEARLLLGQQVPPEAVRWHTAQAQNSDDFADAGGDGAPLDMPKAASAIVPPSFLRLCEVVVLHHDPERFALLYRLLWRLVHEPGLRHDPVDADMSRAHQMAQSVRRDIHKMKALVHFRPTPGGDGETLQLAWVAPAHHIVEAVAPWFAKRHPHQRWAIFTPERSVEWDGRQLHYAHGVARVLAPGNDASDEAWLACHRDVFAPRPAGAGRS